MKRFLVALTAGVVAAAGACSLNPQPFPPDNPDGAINADIDSGKGNDGSFGGDSAGNMPDAADDSAPLPQSDGGADADASDALLDAPSDVIVDVVVVDVSLDVGMD